jgi:predicted nucleic acid-binding protein
LIVLDASALVDRLLDREPKASWVAERLLQSGGIPHAPHLIDIEVLSAIRRLALHGHASSERAALALHDLGTLRLQRYPHLPLLDRIWELRDNLTAADAAYIALAEALDAPLVTTDASLASVPGHWARVEAFTSRQ